MLCVRGAIPLWLLGILCVPFAAAWEASFVSTPSEVGLRESLLVAGALDARAIGGAGTFGAPRVDLVAFDVPADINVCLDQAGEAQTDPGCAGEVTRAARLYVLAGGIVARPLGEGELVLRSDATAAALGGPNVTINQVPVGPGAYSGGRTTLVANASGFLVRPIQPLASIEVRGAEGFRTYNGSAFTMFVTNVSQARVEGTGAFLGGPGLDVNVTRAGLRRAEAGIRVGDLYALLREIQPPERADRRADLADAFGSFQLVPALLDGAVAGRTNLSMNGAPRAEFTLVRVADFRAGHDGVNWTGSGNASYLIEGEVLAPRPGASIGFPLVIPLLLAAAAIAARVMTPRAAARRARRAAALLVRAGGLALLGSITAAALAPLLGFSPLLDARVLEARSRVQLALLVAGMVATAWFAVGLPGESLARSAFAWRERPRALLIPVLVGLLATLAFVLLAAPVLLSFVARFVRL